MENHEEQFEVTINGWFKGNPLTVKSEETTDGVPIYQCYLKGNVVTQLRQEPSGEWTQLWGDLPKETVNYLGEAIVAAAAQPSKSP